MELDKHHAGTLGDCTLDLTKGRGALGAALIGNHAPNGAESGDGRAESGEYEPEDWLALLRREVGDSVKVSVLKEILEVLDAAGALNYGRPELDDESLARKLEAKHRQAWHLLIAYQEHQRPKRPRPANGVSLTPAEVEAAMQSAFAASLMSSRSMALELGFGTAAGGSVPAQVARKFGYGKYAFCKCCENFQVKLGLGPRQGQRDGAARQAMVRARERQLGKSPKKMEDGR